MHSTSYLHKKMEESTFHFIKILLNCTTRLMAKLDCTARLSGREEERSMACRKQKKEEF